MLLFLIQITYLYLSCVWYHVINNWHQNNTCSDRIGICAQILYSRGPRYVIIENIHFVLVWLFASKLQFCISKLWSSWVKRDEWLQLRLVWTRDASYLIIETSFTCELKMGSRKNFEFHFMIHNHWPDEKIPTPIQRPKTYVELKQQSNMIYQCMLNWQGHLPFCHHEKKLMPCSHLLVGITTLNMIFSVTNSNCLAQY